ncbi:MAG TPA: hypothetical protein VIJ47_10215 [Acidimicrobiales bacterium]
MVIPPPAYREFREAYRRGDTATVLGTGQHVLDALGAEGTDASGMTPAVLVMIGAHLARAEHLLDAIAYLERGLAQLPDSRATREVGAGDWYRLLLVQLQLLVGRYQAAWPSIHRLIEPDRSLESRLGATRAQVQVNAAFGDFETAYQLLNTAAGLADRLRSRQQAAMVAGDRAIVLALHGRTIEAASFADAVLPDLARPCPGPLGAWAAAQAVTVAATVARRAADAGDLLTAQRLLFGAEGPAAASGRSIDRGQLALAHGVVAYRAGDLLGAEAPLAEARQLFQSLGCAPAAAQVQWEEAQLARARGLHASAQPLLARAREEFTALGLPAPTP